MIMSFNNVNSFQQATLLNWRNFTFMLLALTQILSHLQYTCLQL